MGWHHGLRLLLAAALMAAIGVGPSVALAAGPSITPVPILRGYTRPVLVVAAPGDPSRLYVVEQTGRIKVARRTTDGWVKEGTFLDLTALVSDPTVEGSGERGLLGLAFPPDHASTGRFYVSYTRREPSNPFGGGESIVAEYIRRTATEADPGSARRVLLVHQPYANHNGGHLAFGPDGLLYLGFGDGGGYGDPEGRAQDLGAPLGKLWRFDPTDPDGTGPLTRTIPADNPYVDVVGAVPETWLRGVRNPWRFSFDRATGDLWIGDVGEGRREEIDRLRASGGTGAGRGANLGWSACEGDLTFPGGSPCDPAANGFVRPLRTWGRPTTGPFAGSCSVTGGFVYRGSVRAWQGVYLAGDFCSGAIHAFGAGGKRLLSTRTGRLISSFGEDAAGRLYLVDLGGDILRLAFGGDPTP